MPSAKQATNQKNEPPHEAARDPLLNPSSETSSSSSSESSSSSFSSQSSRSSSSSDSSDSSWSSDSSQSSSSQSSSSSSESSSSSSSSSSFSINSELADKVVKVAPGSSPNVSGTYFLSGLFNGYRYYTRIGGEAILEKRFRSTREATNDEYHIWNDGNGSWLITAMEIGRAHV